MTEREKNDSVFVELEEAWRLLDGCVKPLEEVEASLEEAAGRLLARDVICMEGHPPFDRAAMDGYAVIAREVPGPGAKLRLAGTVKAGGKPVGRVAPGTCVKVMTGAPLPEGANSVVIQEEAREVGDEVIFTRAATEGRNIRFAGEDVAPGQVACAAGTVLSPAAIGVCALAGAHSVTVRRRPLVSVITTGDEIAEPWAKDVPLGFIRNSNGPMLMALIRAAGAEGKYLGVVPDEPAKLEAAIEEGLQSDLLLVTGGVSVGQFDYVPEVFTKLGLRYLYKKVKIKPGKPVSFAYGERGKVFGLPGNPVSVLTSYHLFVLPTLRRMMGWEGPRSLLKGQITTPHPRDPERTSVIPCRYCYDSARLCVKPVKINGSADLVGASKATCLAIIPRGEGIVAEGTMLDLIMLDQS